MHLKLWGMTTPYEKELSLNLNSWAIRKGKTSWAFVGKRNPPKKQICSVLYEENKPHSFILYILLLYSDDGGPFFPAFVTQLSTVLGRHFGESTKITMVRKRQLPRIN